MLSRHTVAQVWYKMTGGMTELYVGCKVAPWFIDDSSPVRKYGYFQ